MKRALALLAGACAAVAAAQEMSVSGTNTVRLERYDTHGDRTSSPFPVTTNTGYDELILNFAWQPSSFDRWRGLFAGVANDSPYRSRDRGIVPERMLVARENGEAAIPYRAEAGDFFAFTSIRTQQRPLKGLALELQPVLDSATVRTSILAFAGAFQPTWRHFQWGDDHSLGLSWLTEIGASRVTVNAVRSERDADAQSGRGDRTQDVASIAADAPFALGGVLWRAEGEAAALRGDVDDPLDPAGGRDRRDSGLFAQLSGTLTATPLTLRVRGERYGRGYRPFGAFVPADRRSAEAHVSWQAPNALLWRARVQEFRDAYETPQRFDTRVVGAAVSGPIAPLEATLNVDAFRQELERVDRSMDQRTVNVNASVSRPFGAFNGQLGLLYQDMDDGVIPDASSTTRQATVSVIAPLRFGSFTGTIAPGVTWREIRGSPLATRDVQANLQVALVGGAHRLSLSAGHLAQEPSRSAFPDVATVNFSADYRFRWGRHELGAEVVVFDRRPSPGEKTEAYRAGLSWTYAFEATPLARPAGAGAAIAAAPSGPLPGDVRLLAAIAPGDDLEATLARLAASGIAGGSRIGDAIVFERRLLPEVDQRQRVAIVHSGGRIERVALLVSLSDAGGADDAARVHEGVRRALIERFGRPATTFEEGTFGPGFARDVASGRLVRVTEWRTERGVLRLGIPRRLDGIARIEVQHAAAFGSPRDTAWGLDAVR